jgi:SAM-dependent methyltransferase
VGDPELPPLWEDLDFLSPMSARRATELAAFLGGAGPGLVADLGCGWARLLLLTLAANPGLRGLGVDSDPAKIEHGRDQARALGLDGRVELVAADAAVTDLPPARALICVGASQIWGPAERDDLDYGAALAALRAAVGPDGRVVYGEAIWSRPPPGAAAAALEGSATQFLLLPDLVELAQRHGFRARGIGEASLEEWDAFESGYGWGYQRWLREHGPDHPDHAEVARQAGDHRRRWLSGYRGVLGMAYLQLVAD